METIIGWCAAAMGVVMSLAYYPQAYKIWRTKSSEDISVFTYLMFGIGTVVWFIYGAYLRDSVIMIGFLFGVIGSWLVLLLSLRYKKRIPAENNKKG